MSNYTKTTNFASKDNLSPGNPLKIVKGTEIDTEFNNIQTAVATKTDNSAANITGGSITGITDLAVADGGTGASTATAALNNLLPSQTSNANKYLQTDGTNATWDAVSLSTSDITGTLPVANGGTGVTSSTGTGNVVLSNSPTLVTPALGTPSALVGTNITGTASGLTAGTVTTNANLTGGVTSVGNAATVVTNANLTGAVTSVGNATSLGSFSSANLLAALTDETGTGSAVFATSPTLVTPALGTPSALVGTNITGTASGLTAGNVTTNANLTGAVTSVGNATSLGSFTSAQLLGALSDETGTGSAVFATSPTLVTPILGTPTSATLTNATGLPIATGVSGLGTGIATALAVNTGSSGAPVINGGVLGTPSSGTVTNLTGTASININGTVGATTASTGAFTTLTTSSTVTHNGGTANGVTYLNGSKVLTSGSALTFDGTNFSIGGGSSSSRFNVTNGSSGGFEINPDGTASGPALIAYNRTGSAYLQMTYTALNHVFQNSGSEQMRLTSTGLGIGTSSPATKLNISGSSNTLLINGSATSANFARFTSTGGDGVLGLESSTAGSICTGSSAYATLLYTVGATSLQLGTNSAVRATIDSSGNLGLGVTPSAWSGTYYKVLEGGDANSQSALGFRQDIHGIDLYTNTVLDSGGNKYKFTGASGRFSIEANTFFWQQAASGTAGNAITFTQAMTLDASGNLGIGTTSPVAQIDANKGGAAYSGNLYLTGKFTDGTAALKGVALGYDNSSQTGIVYAFTGSAASNLAFYTYPGSGSATERARFDSSGNLLVGTTTSPTGSNNIVGTATIAGGYSNPAAGTTAMAFGSYKVVKVTPNATATLTTTVAPAGSTATLIILTSGTSSYTLTFGTGFKTTGTLATGTTSARYFMVSFVSDGTNMLETARTTAIT